MDKMLRATIVAANLCAAFTLLPAIAPAAADNAVSTTPTDFVTAGSACGSDAVLDESTAAQARQRVEAVGYTDVKLLERECDNSWRATGIKGGERRNLIITPDGGVMPGGN
ncbi:MAG: hypothetical protein IPK59_22570 [Rhodospirillaceae bacterium]|nr:hypothetical protein [Rhodospirillaceae bacterium]